MMTNQKVVIIVRWVARITGLGLFVLWGAFFIEHLAYFADVSNMPPLDVWVAQIAHLVLLLGFLIALKWEAVGSGLIILGAAVFFALTAGANFLVYFLLTITPALLYVFCWLRSKPARPELVR
ncbi:MAG: hypothetical protein MI924_33665 [Chloroflexales bacterium]|nr:hypothetical protein [Chloroflexales bacterium]